MARPDAAEWKHACDNKKRTLERTGTYEKVTRTENQKVVRSRWAFNIARGPNGETHRHKARVVTQGPAPITKAKLPAITTENDLKAHHTPHTDVKLTCPNRKSLNEIFMEAPPGFDVSDGMVLRFTKTVHGTKRDAGPKYVQIETALPGTQHQHTDADHAAPIRLEDNEPPPLLVLDTEDIQLSRRRNM